MQSNLKLPVLFSLLMPVHVALAETPSLSLPLDCEPGKTCFIQNYVDTDPADGAVDYACGGATYDGHKGTDFRILSAAVAQKDVKVRAAAPGVIKAVRDGMADLLVFRTTQTQAVKGRECGNGVVLDHGNGWETQYCHMRRGSVRVRKGETVARGAPLGFVGYSGLAAFAHVHIAVRHKGRIIDPFTGGSPGNPCGDSKRNGLWTIDVSKAFAYRNGVLIASGFATRTVNTKDLESGRIGNESLSREAPMLIFYARFINLQKGDSIQLELKGPSGFHVKNKGLPLAKRKAQFVSFLGKRQQHEPWPQGRYQGSIQLVRKGKIISTHNADLVLR